METVELATAKSQNRLDHSVNSAPDGLETMSNSTIALMDAPYLVHEIALKMQEVRTEQRRMATLVEQISEEQQRRAEAASPDPSFSEQSMSRRRRSHRPTVMPEFGLSRHADKQNSGSLTSGMGELRAKDAVVCVQARARGLLARRRKEKQAGAVVKLQGNVRGMLGRGYASQRKESWDAAVVMQRHARGRSSRKEIQEKLLAPADRAVRTPANLGAAKAWQRSGRIVMIQNATVRSFEIAAAEKTLSVKAYNSYESWLQFRTDREEMLARAGVCDWRLQVAARRLEVKAAETEVEAKPEAAEEAARQATSSRC